MNTISKIASCSAIALAICSTNAANAQEQASPESAPLSKEKFDDFRGTFKDALVTGGPLGRTTAVSDGAQQSDDSFTPDFEISSPDGSTIVGTASISSTGPITPRVWRDGTDLRYRYGRRNFTAKLTVPFNDTDDNPFVRFKNIGNDVQFEFDFSAYVVGGRTDTNSSRLDVAMTERCLVGFDKEQPRADALKGFKSAQATALTKVRNSDPAKYGNFTATQIPVGLIWDAVDEKSPGMAQAITACRVGENNSFKNFERLTDEYSGSVTYYGLSGRAGLEQYELLNQTAFALENENRLGFELESYAGKITANGNAAVRLSASFARGFDADEPMEVCQDDMSGMQNCLSGLLQPPQSEDKFFAGIEGRLILSRNEEGEPTMAIAPQFTYDTEDDEFLVEVPLYLQRNEDSGLDAGIEFNYSSERDDFAVGFFVGVPLKELF